MKSEIYYSLPLCSESTIIIESVQQYLLHFLLKSLIRLAQNLVSITVFIYNFIINLQVSIDHHKVYYERI